MSSRQRNLLLLGCSVAVLVFLLRVLIPAEDQTYEYGTSSGGLGGSGWPVWVENLTIDDSFGVPVGNLDGGTPGEAPLGSLASLGPIPLPKTVSARWFSFRNQTFYEVEAEIDAESRKKIRGWYKEFPRPQYLHHLSIGYAGQGHLSAWWMANCIHSSCEDKVPRSNTFMLLEKAAAQEASGDPRGYVVRSEEYVRAGRMPPVKLPVRPDPGTGSENLVDYRTITLGTDYLEKNYHYILMFPDGMEMEGSVNSGVPLQWPDTEHPPNQMRLFDAEGNPLQNQNILTWYHGYDSKESRRTDGRGFLEVDQRFVKPPKALLNVE